MILDGLGGVGVSILLDLDIHGSHISSDLKVTENLHELAKVFLDESEYTAIDHIGCRGLNGLGILGS